MLSQKISRIIRMCKWREGVIVLVKTTYLETCNKNRTCIYESSKKKEKSVFEYVLKTVICVRTGIRRKLFQINKIHVWKLWYTVLNWESKSREILLFNKTDVPVCSALDYRGGGA